VVFYKIRGYHHGLMQDIRWIQRFSNFNRALKKLTEAVDLSKTRELSEYKNGSDIDLTIVGENLREDLRSGLVDKFDEAAIPYQGTVAK
jgi:phosphoribosylamine-glycine ligase